MQVSFPFSYGLDTHQIFRNKNAYYRVLASNWPDGLTVSLRTVMKLMWKFFLDSKSVNNRFKSDLVTRLSTPASSTTYDSFGGPSFRTSNSDPNADPLGITGQKLSARETAIAASPCCRWENQVLGTEIDWEICFLRLQLMGFVLSWTEGE